MTAILYQKLAGNPRRIKRFLNDMSVRRSIAARRGIELDNEVVAKLMVLEVLLPEQFKVVLSWLRGGELRDRLTVLERIANNAETETTDNSGSEPTTEADTESADRSANEEQNADRPDVLKGTTTREDGQRCQGDFREEDGGCGGAAGGRRQGRRVRRRRSGPRLDRRHVSGPWLRRRPHPLGQAGPAARRSEPEPLSAPRRVVQRRSPRQRRAAPAAARCRRSAHSHRPYRLCCRRQAGRTCPGR